MSDVPATAVDAPLAAAPVPWTQALVHSAPVAPAWTGVGIWAALVLLCLAYFAVFTAGGLGRAAFWQQTFPPTAVMALMIAYAPAATAYSQRAAVRVLRELRPRLLCSDGEFEQLERRITAFDTWLLRIAGITFALGVVPLIAFDPTMAPIRARASIGDPVFLWVCAMNVLFGWMMARLIFHELRVSREFSRIGEHYAQVELLNSRPLLPFARRGLQGALVWILFVSLMSLHFAVGSAATIVPLGLVALLGVALAALLLPVWGVHRRLAEQKRAELERLCAGIAAARAGVLDSPTAAPADAATRLASLLLLKQHVEAAREWPFDVPILARFALYVTIGLGSWLGGAVVERLLDAAVPGR